MSNDHLIQRPVEGSGCLAAPDFCWEPARIHRVNEDGTFSIEFDEKQMTLMPYWYGVTSDQLSVNDEALWPDMFERLTSGSSGLARSTFGDVMSSVGYHFDGNQLIEFWGQQCKELFDLESADAILNQEQAYRLLRRAGCSAKRIARADNTEVDYYKLYWNQIRMAGRQPGEISRPVTIDDAFAALGVLQPALDSATVARIDAFQNDNHIEVPSNLYRFLCCAGISGAVVNSHPNNPELVLPEDDDFEFQRDPPLQTSEADYALTIMMPHQGDHVWAAVFNRGDTDARVYVTWDDEHWMLTSPTIGMFFWDLAQTGLMWCQDTGHDGGKRIEMVDIGVVPAAVKKRSD